MRDYWTLNDLLALNHPSLPSTRVGLDKLVQRDGWRSNPRLYRIGAGRRGHAAGEFAYHWSLLPADLRAAISVKAAPPSSPALSEAWIAFDRLPEKTKKEAAERLGAVERVECLTAAMTRGAAISHVADETNVCVSTLRGWLRLAAGVARADRLPVLAPKHKGRIATADCDPRAWDFFVADYLRAEQPCLSACHGRLLDAAQANEWSPVPSLKTLQRRLQREIPRGARVMARSGRSDAQRLFPAQMRDRSVFGPLEAVNADGHKFDVFVKMPDGEVIRPVLLAVQDLYSGMIVGWRLGEGENWPMVRLAFLDMMTGFGIPEHVYFDNGRAFASKWMTGGSVSRFRFTVKEGEQQGLLTAVGCEVHWATPYHGQAKPIERAFRDLCEEVAKHPRCAGAYTGNRPDAKPDNYASKALPWADFEALVASEIARHNAKPSRTAVNCRGRSFAETFRQAAENAVIKRASREQLRMFMLASEHITSRAPSGEIIYGKNRYWAEPLVELAGRKVIVRFDPQDLHAGVAVYRTDGRFVAEAACIEATGFNDAEAARRHAAERRRLVRSFQDLLAAERRLTIDEVAQLLPSPTRPEAEPVRPAAVRLVANGGPRAATGWSGSEDFSRAIDLIDRGVIPFPGRDSTP